MVGVELPAVVSVDQRGLVHITHDEVKIPVIVQVRIGGAVGKGLIGQAPWLPHILKTQVSPVPEHLVGNGHRGHFPNDLLDLLLLPGHHHALHHVIGKEIDEVLVGHVIVDAVADIDVLEAVIVRVEHEGAPAPVRRGHAGILRDLAELSIARVELKSVLHVLVIEP